MADYILKNVNNDLWKRIKKMAIDKEMTVKGLILYLLKRELTEYTNYRRRG